MKRPLDGTAPGGAYSPGILADGTYVFVSGQGPLRDGKVIGETVQEQTRQTLDNLGMVLVAAGATYDDVVRCGVFLADIGDFAEMDEVYAEYFASPRPARTTVGVSLAGEMRVEMDCIAALPRGQAADG